MKMEKVMHVARGGAPKSKIARHEVPKQPTVLIMPRCSVDCFVAVAPQNDPQWSPSESIDSLPLSLTPDPYEWADPWVRPFVIAHIPVSINGISTISGPASVKSPVKIPSNPMGGRGKETGMSMGGLMTGRGTVQRGITCKVGNMMMA